MSEIKVSKVKVFPIKSCGPAELESAEVGELGLRYDREWMLIGDKGQFISQRTHAKLALVATALHADTLTVCAPGQEILEIGTEIDTDAPEVTIDLFKKTGTGLLVGREANEYFSEYLQKSVRLVRIQTPRTIKPECHVDGAVTQTGFADGFPVLLASESSMTDLNTHLADPVTIDRFRANIVVEGAPAWDEDYWREIRIGDSMSAFVVRACARCPMPNIDQSVGELPKDRPVTRALREYRGGVDPINDSKGEFFGQNLAHIFAPGQYIAPGDSVEILHRSNERNIALD